MSEKVYLPGARAQGMDMPDGRKYNVKRGQEGVIEVSDRDAALIRARTGLQVGEKFHGQNATGRVCSKCFFEQYAAMAGDKCSRCGGAWTPDAPVQAPVQDDGRRIVRYDI